MNSVQSGVRPPQQARSRAALERLLASAEHVLVNDGLDEFTIARVAEHAGVSVGGVYRRFEGKEQLLDAVRQELMARLESAVLTALDGAKPSLVGVVDAFVGALAQTLADSGRIIPVLMAGGRGTESPEQGLRAVIALQQRFVDAAEQYAGQIRRPEPEVALVVAFRSVLGNSAYRAATAEVWPDGLTWDQWSRETSAMTTAYLKSKG